MTNSIAIATMIGQNQGNRLQNYALQKVLSDVTGCNVETLRVHYGTPRTKQLIKNFLSPFMPSKRWARFSDFDNKYICYSKSSINDSTLDAEGYNLYFIGSDQVWNPTFGFTSDAEYLPQIKKEKKCAYAASFGVSEIIENREHTASLLSQIDKISVREDAAADIVEGLIGVRPLVVLDPTMLLKLKDWTAIASKPKIDIPSEGYILKYVLGQNVPDEKALNAAGILNCKIIDLQDRNLPVGPSEFVWLIAHAKFVCTDSFHASVFSTLFHVPFAIFERISANKDMSSRFDTFCKTFGLEDRRIRDNVNLHATINWKNVDDKLEHAKLTSLKFLDDCVSENI